MSGKDSRSLEVISSGGAQGSGKDDGKERRRLPRLSLSGEQFRLSRNGKIFSVTDLSAEGMALRILDQGDFNLFPVATRIEGLINLKGEKHPVRAVVRHLGVDLVGCEFGELEPEARAALTRFLDPAALGRELKPIPVSETQSTIWYHGPSGTDLLFRRGADGQYRRMTLYVLGSFVQWDAEQGLSTGRARVSDERAEARGIVRFETMILDADPRPDAGKLSVAKTLILSSNLAEDFRKWCLRHLESH